MGNLIPRRRPWTLASGILSMVFALSLSAFGQEPALPQDQQIPEWPMMQQKRPAGLMNSQGPAGPANQQAARGTMAQGMPGRGMPGPGAQGPGMQRPGMRGPNGPGMMPGNPEMGKRESMELLRPEIQRELAITVEQRKKLEDIRFNSEKESIQHRAAAQIQRMDLSRLIDAENPDKAVIDKKVQEVAQEEAALMRSSINARLGARAVLTAEQRSKLEQLRENRQGPGRAPAGDMQPGRPAPKAGQAGERTSAPAAHAKPQEK
jgi:Spy/CpxP family protein refolding chaperone